MRINVLCETNAAIFLHWDIKLDMVSSAAYKKGLNTGTKSFYSELQPVKQMKKKKNKTKTCEWFLNDLLLNVNIHMVKALLKTFKL